MELGMIGLGRMGANMARRLARQGHQITAFDPSPEARAQAQAPGIGPVGSLSELIAALPSPRILWLMVPSGQPVDSTLDQILPALAAGDIVIDGGNSNYKDSQRRGARLAELGLHFVDCGTSGGIWGLEEGYSMMIGGAPEVVESLRPIFASLAPSPTSGWGRVGPVGAGHFTKMIHNGIEYGMMEAYAEGFAILHHKREFDLDLHQISEIWREGSVIRSWLLDLTAAALEKDPGMTGLEPWVDDSGEGRWTVAEAIALDVPAPVITMSLIGRLRSRDRDSYSDKLLAAMRQQFGGHAVKKG
ncbi:phosphogluconate dehydrogenase (NAD(+)-dependent, decarboxylating) [Paracoccus aminophilus]|uniref:6-phosphogluconate dehydrogenase n=1 Tax=Paracoccus aminophilus JCM 7686 TaxID=1367847 RepID=S5Y1H1_PARAH|nr:decarboxylating 6-phosphogluconate dehydrogenase [Paracoccus aminophilus]AGT11337.1 6-phosphogluconate dehydrogenase [Paracoccus aminophilus JCM 7686]